MLKIAFIGIGSIGTRHLNNVYDFLLERNVEFEIHIYRSGVGKELSRDLENRISKKFRWTDDIQITEMYDVIFITNPTSLHFDTLCRLQKFGKAFFIEKPVFDIPEISLEDLKFLPQKKCYVACPLRYNSVIQYVKENVDTLDVIGIRAISSSYLPEWRPNMDYRQCYSAHTAMGGGVDIDLIHEWDYITFLFGQMTEGFAIRTKISNLEIDSNDVAIYLARNDNVTVELHLDYYGRSNIRKLELFCKDDTVECDILAGIIKYKKSGKVVAFDAERNISQMKEIEHFFDIVYGKIDSDSTIEHGLKVLHYAKGDF